MRLRITLPLRAVTPILPGSGERGGAADLLLTRTADGAPFVRGAPVAGVLRAHATRIAPLLGFLPCVRLTGDGASRARGCACPVCGLFGPAAIPGQDARRTDDTRDEAFRSPLTVRGGRVALPDGGTPAPVIRDGVAIARATGAADRAAAAKFSLERLPAGVRFTALLELDAPDTWGTVGEARAKDEMRLLHALLVELRREGAIGLGHGRARGMGEIVLDGPVTFADLTPIDDDEDLIERVTRGAHSYAGRTITGPSLLGDPQSHLFPRIMVANGEHRPGVLGTWLRICADVQVDGGFRADDPLAAVLLGFDAAPAWEIDEDETARALLNGAGLRGALRSRAEYLARSYWQWQPGGPAGAGSICPACHPTRDDGPPGFVRCSKPLDAVPEEEEPEEASFPEQCPACRLFGSTREGSRLRVRGGRALRPHHWQPLEHLAIDRFTGGGMAQRKFDSFPAWKPAFHIVLTLEEPQDWEVGWLLALCRMLLAGRITVGGRAGTGNGRLTTAAVRLTVGHTGVLPVWAKPLGPEDGGREGLFLTAGREWRPANSDRPDVPDELQPLLRLFVERARTFRSTELATPPSDLDERQRRLYFTMGGAGG